MKSKVTLMLASLLILGACSTGTYVTRTYDDDIYFTPGDIDIPIVFNDNVNRQQYQDQQRTIYDNEDPQVIISESETYEDGTKSLNNYIFKDKNQNDYLNANMDAMDEFELVQTDTSYIGDEEDYQYIINNYYQMDDLGYASRINRFHRPHYYGSYGWNNGYFDDWYSPYSSWNYGGWGYSPYYSGMYGNSWYSPYYSGYYGGWGWSSYYGGYYSPYYSSGYWGGNGGYWGGNGNIHYSNNDYQYGKRRSSYSTVSDKRSGNNPSTISRTNDIGLKSGSTRVNENSGARDGLYSRRERSIGNNNQETKSATLTEKRRGVDVNSTQNNVTSNRSSVRTGSTNSGNSTVVNRNSSTVVRNNTPSTTSRTYQSGTTTQQRTYVPSYNKPRTVTRSTYNSNSYNRTNNSNSYSSPRVVSRSSSTSTSTSPSSTAVSVKSTYQKSSSYSKGSSSTPSRSSSSYSRPSSSSSSSSSYSPTRSSSSSYSSGSSSGSSSRSSSSGSSGSSRSGSSSGRR